MKREKNIQKNEGIKKRLSLTRLLILVLIIGGFGYYIALNWKDFSASIFLADSNPWFAPYVDVTATPQYDFEKLGNTPAKNVMLSFIVSSSEDSCIPTWGNAYTLEKAGVALDLDRRIARLRQLGGDIAISFGGLLNDELSVKCTDTERLFMAYESVIEKYESYTIDLDLEGEGLTNIEAIQRRAQVMKNLQQKYRSEGKNLAIWLTLPVAPFGLTESGTSAISAMLEQGVDLAGVNIMTMDYGQSKEKKQSMIDATQRALIETHRQLGILYSQSGVNLSRASLWKKIGATPMIGQNDVLEEIFTLEDAKELNKFAREQGIIRLSMWSVNRDVQCGENYVNVSVVSDSCSGIEQERLAFSLALSEGLNGNFRQNESLITVDDVEDEIVVSDDPENSPYPIWSKDSVYLAGTKVAWHKNVYLAKWWTQGDLPDNPVLQSWQTPWQLVGPVLPGEKPVENVTLPEGIYPEWVGTEQYNEGDRVLFNKIPYQAKWWTQGDSPAAASSNPTSSPWVMLNQKQIEEVLNGLEL